MSFFFARALKRPRTCALEVEWYTLYFFFNLINEQYESEKSLVSPRWIDAKPYVVV